MSFVPILLRFFIPVTACRISGQFNNVIKAWVFVSPKTRFIPPNLLKISWTITKNPNRKMTTVINKSVSMCVRVCFCRFSVCPLFRCFRHIVDDRDLFFGHPIVMKLVRGTSPPLNKTPTNVVDYIVLMLMTSDWPRDIYQV